MTDHDRKPGLSMVARDHASYPRHFGSPRQWNGRARITGPCGDTMEFWVTVGDGRVKGVSFTTDGCAPSLACGSMATTLCRDRRVDEAMEISQSDILRALGGIPADSEHCALLAARTLRSAFEDALSETGPAITGGSGDGGGPGS